ncbi:hypothetical protein ACFFMN_23365 [Planobispora siamensis]|uniref:Uncharacterized protein n=1 Tax=Planobispora siamensis TaxID=936338 RepID=A0A8J3SJ25_9ACTN|nr:hypothetical protein [Planobispora siamensis]GIH95303.1 hypothetical protein Psi01_59330 [Planobispora siamensis]
MTTDYPPERSKAQAALDAYHADGGDPAELTGRFVVVGRFEYGDDQGPVVLYEVREADDTAWLDPEGYIAAISLTQYFEDD